MISKFIEKRIQKMLDEWYTAIGKRKMDDAAALKEKIDQHLPKLKRTQNFGCVINCSSHATSSFLKTRTGWIHYSMSYMNRKTKWMMN